MLPWANGGIQMGIFGWVFLAVLVLLIIFAISIYNRLVRLRALVKEGFSGITVQLRRRADLIPNLVQTVQGYATHEREVFDEVTARRAEATNAGSVEATAAADAHMTGLLSRLFAVAEAYPELRASDNFQQLQAELSDIEGKIAIARQIYNDAVLSYDNALETVPTNVVAGMFNFEPRPYFEAEEAAVREAPSVRF